MGFRSVDLLYWGMHNAKKTTIYKHAGCHVPSGKKRVVPKTSEVRVDFHKSLEKTGHLVSNSLSDVSDDHYKSHVLTQIFDFYAIAIRLCPWQDIGDVRMLQNLAF